MEKRAGGRPGRPRGREAGGGGGGGAGPRPARAGAPVGRPPLPLWGAAGALLLAAIAVRLASDGARRHKVKNADSLRSAVAAILLADLVMSLDNVLAVAALARGNPVLLVCGIVLSVPLIPWGSAIMMRLLHRFPPLLHAGAAMLGYAAGDMFASDRLAGPWLAGLWRKADAAAPLFGATAVLVFGLLRHLFAQAGTDGKKRRD